MKGYCWHEHGHSRTPVSQTHRNSRAFPRSGSGKWQGLPLAHMWMLTVCTENMDCSFLFQDVYSPRVLPYTHRLVNPDSLFGLAAYNKHTMLLDGWSVTPACTPFLHRCLFLHFLFPWLGQSNPCKFEARCALGNAFWLQPLSVISWWCDELGSELYHPLDFRRQKMLPAWRCPLCGYL